MAGQSSQASPTPSPSPSSCPGLVSNGQLSQPAGQSVGSLHQPSSSLSKRLWSRGHGSHASPTPSRSPSVWSGFAIAGQSSQASPIPSPSPSSCPEFSVNTQLSSPAQTPSPSKS